MPCSFTSPFFHSSFLIFCASITLIRRPFHYFFIVHICLSTLYFSIFFTPPSRFRRVFFRIPSRLRNPLKHPLFYFYFTQRILHLCFTYPCSFFLIIFWKLCAFITLILFVLSLVFDAPSRFLHNISTPDSRLLYGALPPISILFITCSVTHASLKYVSSHFLHSLISYGNLFLHLLSVLCFHFFVHVFFTSSSLSYACCMFLHFFLCKPHLSPL